MGVSELLPTITKKRKEFKSNFTIVGLAIGFSVLY